MYQYNNYIIILFIIVIVIVIDKLLMFMVYINQNMLIVLKIYVMKPCIQESNVMMLSILINIVQLRMIYNC